MKNSSDGRSPLAVAFAWTSRITTISLQMVLPGLLGYWLDRYFETKPVFLILGVIFGFTSGMMTLLKLSRESARENQKK